MLIDHVGVLFFPGLIIFRIIGRLSFPLFAYSIARGYRHTSNYNKYLVRLIIFALTSQLPYYIVFNNNNLNVGFTLAAGLLCLKLHDANINIFVKIISLFSLLFLSYILKCEYNIYGILTILLFHLYYNKDSLIIYYSILTIFSVIIFRYDPIQLVSFLSIFIILILSIKNKTIKFNKFFQYTFYPLHLLLLYFIKGGLWNEKGI